MATFKQNVVRYNYSKTTRYTTYKIVVCYSSELQFLRYYPPLRICRQNTQFNMYTTTSKQQEGCTFKDSHPKCFITTNFDKFHREAFPRGGDRGDVLTARFRDIQSQRSIRMAFVIIMILFDVKDYRLLYGSISLSPHSEKIYT